MSSNSKEFWVLLGGFMDMKGKDVVYELAQSVTGSY